MTRLTWARINFRSFKRGVSICRIIKKRKITDYALFSGRNKVAVLSNRDHKAWFHTFESLKFKSLNSQAAQPYALLVWRRITTSKCDYWTDNSSKWRVRIQREVWSSSNRSKTFTFIILTKRSVIISLRIDQRYCVVNLTELRLTQCTAGWAVYFGLSVVFINRAPITNIALSEPTSLVPVPSQFNYFTLP